MKKVLYGVIALLSLPGLVAAQAPLTAEDTQAINQLTTGYLQALGTCNAAGFADLFVPKTGYFSSSIRGQMTGRDGLTGLVESERHCTDAQGSQPAARVGGGTPAPAELKVTPTGVQGTVDLGPKVGHYEDQYVKTPAGWRIAARTVVTAAETNAGLSASDFAAINALGGPSPGNHYVERDGVKRLMSSGVAISVANGRVTGRAYQKDGSFFDEAYEKKRRRGMARSVAHPRKAQCGGLSSASPHSPALSRTWTARWPFITTCWI